MVSLALVHSGGMAVKMKVTRLLSGNKTTDEMNLEQIPFKIAL
jgi:hypothetical protein